MNQQVKIAVHDVRPEASNSGSVAVASVAITVANNTFYLSRVHIRREPDGGHLFIRLPAIRLPHDVFEKYAG